MLEVIATTDTIPHQCVSCSVRQTGICAHLTPEQLIAFAQHTRHSHHQAGETLASETDTSAGYAMVVEGVIKLTRLLQDGRQQLVGLQFASDLLGRLYSSENPTTAEAVSEIELCRMPKSILESAVAESSALKDFLLRRSLQELDDAREWMVTLGRKTAPERVASILLLFALRNRRADAGKDSAVTFDLPLIRADMADFLGLTIETVSRQISKLREDGVIIVTSHRHVVVPDLERLRRRAGQSELA
ncbi:MAG TPA: Crp/Fnr family transcriptional regulator [Devosia sp.]